MNTIKNAKFIKENADFGTVVPVFIKAIKSEKAIGKATLFCSALGSYEAYINGKRIGDFIFAPGWTTYGKRLHGYGTTETVTFKHWRFVHGWTNSVFKRIMLQKTDLS